MHLLTQDLYSVVGLPLALEETYFLQPSSVVVEAGGTAAAVVAPWRLLLVDGVPYVVDLQPPSARARLGTLDWAGTGGLHCPVGSLAVAAVVDGVAAAVDGVAAAAGDAVAGVDAAAAVGDA